MARGDKPSADRKLSLKERRLARKSRYKKPKQTKSRKPTKAKYVSTQYTLTDDPIVNTTGEQMEVNRSYSDPDAEANKNKKVKKTTKFKTFLKDAVGNRIHLKDKDRTEVTEENWVNDGTFEKRPNENLGSFSSEDLAKRYPSKKTGVKVNEVYKLRNMGDMFGTGKDSYDIDIKRRVSQSNRATDLQNDYRRDDNAPVTATERDYAKTMKVEKFRGPGGLKRREKNYVSKADMGGTKNYKFEDGTYDFKTETATPGRYTQTGGHKNTKKEMRDQGYKTVSDKRFNRIARRQGFDYKTNKMAQGMDQAAGGLHGDKQSYESGLENKRNFSEAVGRLFTGTWKGSDLNRANKSGRKRRK
jgi:hypothetical protein